LTIIEKGDFGDFSQKSGGGIFTSKTGIPGGPDEKHSQ